MLFSSNIFLFLFLPAYLAVYHGADLLGRAIARAKPGESAWGQAGTWARTHLTDFNNLVLLGLSLFFYFWGSGRFIVVFVSAIVVNAALGNVIERAESRHRKPWLIVGVVANLTLLLYFKYFGFLYAQTSSVLAAFHIPIQPIDPIFLPVGVSFFTFMAISFLVEVYQGNVRGAGWLRFSTYFALFPHLVAGPIVRYSEIDKELRGRTINQSMLFEGMLRFNMGLGKKVILANNLGGVADKIFALPAAELTTAFSWLGAVCYTLQIYFDFSGYTDMAIGLARFFGFHFPENFNKPYQARNMTDFWRRWHMSLSRWFKDYLYIALGGNRVGPFRTYLNLLIVFLLCGLWHGAAWTFVVWGLYHGALLVGERLLRLRFGFEPTGPLGRGLTLLLVIIGWVIFRATSWSQATVFLSAMWGNPVPTNWRFFELQHYVDGAVLAYLIVGTIITLVSFDTERLRAWMGPRLSTAALGTASLATALVAVAMLSKTQFNPFIYFQF